MGKQSELLRITTEEEPFVFGFSNHEKLNDSLFDVHYELEIGMVLQGQMCRHWENTKRILTPGQVWITGVWEPHGFTLVEVPCKVAVFLMRPPVLSTVQLGIPNSRSWMSLFLASPSLRPQLSQGDAEYFLTHIQRLNQQQNENPLCKAPHNIRNTATPSHNMTSLLALLTLLDALQSNWHPSKPAGNTDTVQSISPAVETVLTSQKSISEAQAASLCSMSNSTFRRKFSHAMGISFGKFALNHRLKSAASALKISDSIEDIAYTWGFCDVSHFYKSFKKVFKETPAQYQKRFINPNSEIKNERQHKQ